MWKFKQCWFFLRANSNFPLYYMYVEKNPIRLHDSTTNVQAMNSFSLLPTPWQFICVPVIRLFLLFQIKRLQSREYLNVETVPLVSEKLSYSHCGRCCNTAGTVWRVGWDEDELDGLYLRLQARKQKASVACFLAALCRCVAA